MLVFCEAEAVSVCFAEAVAVDGKFKIKVGCAFRDGLHFGELAVSITQESLPTESKHPLAIGPNFEPNPQL